MFFSSSTRNEEEKEVRRLGNEGRDEGSASVVIQKVKATTCALKLAGIGTLGKINVYDKQKNVPSSATQTLAFLGTSGRITILWLVCRRRLEN